MFKQIIFRNKLKTCNIFVSYYFTNKNFSLIEYNENLFFIKLQIGRLVIKIDF